MKSLIISFLLISVYSGIYAQTGIITGRVVTSDNQPASDVKISLKETEITEVTDQNGIFRIMNLEDGKYTVSVSLPTLRSNDINISVRQGATSKLSQMILKTDLEHLNKRKRRRRFRRKKSSLF